MSSSSAAVPDPAGHLWGYARPSGVRPLDRQLELLRAAGVPEARMLVDDHPVRRQRPRLQAFRDDVAGARVPSGSVLVVEALDRLGLTVRETARLVLELHEHGIGVLTLADVVDVDTTPPLTPAADLVLAMLRLIEQADAMYTSERVEISRAAANQDGRRLGRARQVTPEVLQRALQLYDEGVPVAQIEQRVNITRTTLYRLGALERGAPLGVRRRRRPRLPAETRTALLALKGSTSARRAAALYQVSPSTVHALWRQPEPPSAAAGGDRAWGDQ